MKRTFINGSKEGPSNSYFFDNKPDGEGVFLDDERDGLWKWYNPDNTLSSVRNYISGDLNGASENYDLFGKIRSNQEYINGDVYGTENIFYYNGNKKEEVTYWEDDENGPTKYYGFNGEHIMTLLYQHGTLTKVVYINGAGGKPDTIPAPVSGAIEAKYANGKTAFLLEYKSGYQNGKYREYFEDGTPCRESQYTDGSLDGERKTWYRNGKLRSTENFKMNDNDGIVTLYHESGIKKAEISYKSDVIHGPVKYFDTSGKLIAHYIFYNSDMIKKYCSIMNKPLLSFFRGAAQKKILLYTFSAMAISIASQQKIIAQPRSDLFRLQQKFADQSIVYTSVNENVNIEVINGKFDIKMNVDRESILLDDRAALYSEGSVSYSSLIYLAGIEASTLYPNEKRYKEIKVENFKENDRFSDIAFYDDIKEKKFNYPSLIKGAKRKLNLTYEIKDPYLLSSFMLQDYIPIENATLKIVCPNDMEIGYKIFNGDSVNVIYESHQEKGKTIHEWKCADIKQFESESGSQGRLYYLPHIVYYIKSFAANGKREKVLESVDDLHAYYSKLVKGINDETSEPLKKLVDSLTANKTTDEQKIKAVFYWVKDNIKYIAFESGYEGFIPNSAKNIFEKRFGDCKGMASIITKMLDYAHIPAYLTWIGTRELPYLYKENPTSGSDNHMIASVKLGSNYVFLDGTSTTTPFGYPSEFIQGKQAIVHLTDTKYELVTVPEVSDSLNITRDSVYVEVTKDLKLTGAGYSEFTGFERDEILDVLDDRAGEEKFTRLKNYFQKGNNKFMLESYQESDASDRDKPFAIQYKFNVSDYILQSGKEIFVNLNLERAYSKATVEKTRELDLSYNYKQLISNTATIKIPEGYQLTYLPPNDSLNNELLAYNIHYTQTDKTITLHAEIRLKCLLLKKKDFETWNNLIARLKKNYSESVTFRAK